jgi:hypothetical protein
LIWVSLHLGHFPGEWSFVLSLNTYPQVRHSAGSITNLLGGLILFCTWGRCSKSSFMDMCNSADSSWSVKFSCDRRSIINWRCVGMELLWQIMPTKVKEDLFGGESPSMPCLGLLVFQCHILMKSELNIGSTCIEHVRLLPAILIGSKSFVVNNG